MRLPGPGDGADPTRAASPRVLEEALVQGSAESRHPMVRARPDHVDVGLVGAIRADEPDEEADEPPTVVLDDPRRAGEVLEPQPRQDVVEPAAAPPVVDLPDDDGVVGFDRASEPQVVAHRAASQARTPAAANSTRTSGP